MHRFLSTIHLDLIPIIHCKVVMLKDALAVPVSCPDEYSEILDRFEKSQN